jgi:hypothetical protein
MQHGPHPQVQTVFRFGDELAQVEMDPVQTPRVPGRLLVETPRPWRDGAGTVASVRNATLATAPAHPGRPSGGDRIRGGEC